TLGAKAVTQYAVPFQLVLITSGMFSVALAALMPAVTAHNAVGDSETLSAGYLLFVRVALVFAAGACLCLWLGGRSLLQHWAGAGVFPGYATFGIQLALLFIQVLVAPGDAILMGTSRHYVYARLAVLEGVLNLALSLW